jgi:hypothetical protein
MRLTNLAPRGRQLPRRRGSVLHPGGPIRTTSELESLKAHLPMPLRVVYLTARPIRPGGCGNPGLARVEVMPDTS